MARVRCRACGRHGEPDLRASGRPVEVAAWMAGAAGAVTSLFGGRPWVAVLSAAVPVVVRVTRVSKRRPTCATCGSSDVEHLSQGTTNPDSGPEITAWRSEDVPEGQKLVLSERVTLTLRGPSAGAVVEKLRATMGMEWQSRIPQIALSLARHNVECPEVDSWRRRLRALADQLSRETVATGHDIAKLAQDDPDLLSDLLERARNAAFDEVTELHGLDGRARRELNVRRPRDLTTDDALLGRLNDAALMGVYAYAADWAGEAVRIDEGGDLDEWVKLAEAGLVLRGDAVPPEALAKVYTLEELNAALQPEKPIRRRVAAALLLTPEAAARLPDIRRVFYVITPEPGTAEALAAFAWAMAHARLLVITADTAERTATAIREGRAAGAEMFSISGDCCKDSESMERKPMHVLPASLPPYHIGCRARVLAH